MGLASGCLLTQQILVDLGPFFDLALRDVLLLQIRNEVQGFAVSLVVVERA